MVEKAQTNICVFRKAYTKNIKAKAIFMSWAVRGLGEICMMDTEFPRQELLKCFWHFLNLQRLWPEQWTQVYIRWVVSVVSTAYSQSMWSVSKPVHSVVTPWTSLPEMSYPSTSVTAHGAPILIPSHTPTLTTISE